MWRRAMIAVLLSGLAAVGAARVEARAADEPGAAFIGSEVPDRVKELEPLLKELVAKGDADEIVRMWLEDPLNSWGNIIQKYGEALLSLEREKYVPAFMTIIRSSKQRVTSYPVSALARLREPAFLEYLKTLLDEKPLTDEEIKAIETEIEKLTSEDEEVRTAAIAEITKYGSRARPVLLPYTTATNKTQRDLIYRFLYLLPDNDPARLLSMTWRYEDKDRVVFAEAVAAQKEVRPEDLARALEVLSTTKPADYKELCIALVNRPKRLSGTMDDSSYAISLTRAAIKALGNCGDPEVSPNLHRFMDADFIAACGDAAEALLKLGDKTQIENMKTLCKKSNAPLVTGADVLVPDQLGKVVLALLKMGDRTVIDGYFASGEEKLQLGAMRVAAEAGDRDSVPKIIDVFKTTSNKKHACDALNAIGDIIKTADAETIKMTRETIAAWKESDAPAYYRALGVLIGMGDAESLKEVEQAIEKADAELKPVILRRIADFPSLKLLPIYIKALDDMTVVAYDDYDRWRGMRPVMGGPRKGQVRELAAEEITRISGLPIDLWNFNRDRQIAEIKAWWEKRQ